MCCYDTRGACLKFISGWNVIISSAKNFKNHKSIWMKLHQNTQSKYFYNLSILYFSLQLSSKLVWLVLQYNDGVIAYAK